MNISTQSKPSNLSPAAFFAFCLLTVCLFHSAKANETIESADTVCEHHYGLLLFEEFLSDQKFTDRDRIFNGSQGESSKNLALTGTLSSCHENRFYIFGVSNQHYKDRDKKFNIEQRSLFVGMRSHFYQISSSLDFVPGVALHLMNFDIENRLTDSNEFFDPAAVEGNLGLAWHIQKTFTLSFEVFRIEGFGFSSNGIRLGLGTKL